MTWIINYSRNFKQTDECCLELCHRNKSTPLRAWFGPLASQLFQLINNQINLTKLASRSSFIIEKHQAQYLPIQASFLLQRCQHLYQVNKDLKHLDSKYQHEVCEILLFIRMSNQHPKQQTLQLFTDIQLPHCTDIETAIDVLLKAKLIQKIQYNDWVFYDKIPYPHDHVLDLNSLKLVDYNHSELRSNQQKLLISQMS